MTEYRSSSIADFSKRHGWSEVTTYRLIRAGDLRAVKVGRRTVILDEDERAFLASLPALKSIAA